MESRSIEVRVGQQQGRNCLLAVVLRDDLHGCWQYWRSGIDGFGEGAFSGSVFVLEPEIAAMPHTLCHVEQQRSQPFKTVCVTTIAGIRARLAGENCVRQVDCGGSEVAYAAMHLT